MKCTCGYLPSGGMELNAECPLHGKPSVRATGSRARFHFVEVVSPGAEGTINLFFDGVCLAWVDNKMIAARIKEHLRENDQRQATASK